MDRRDAIRWLDVVVYLLMFLGAASSLFFAYKSKQLQQELMEARQAGVGDYLPVVSARTLNSGALGEKGTQVEVAAPRSGEQLLYFFSPRCPYCLKSAPHVEQFYRNNGAKLEMLAVSSLGADETTAYLKTSGSQIPTVSISDPRVRSLFRIKTVPALVRVDRDGKILYVRYGQLNPST